MVPFMRLEPCAVRLRSAMVSECRHPAPRERENVSARRRQVPTEVVRTEGSGFRFSDSSGGKPDLDHITREGRGAGPAVLNFLHESLCAAGGLYV